MSATIALTCLAAAHGLQAQSLGSRIGAAGPDALSFRYAARPGICGDGRSFVRVGDNTYIGTYRRGDERRPCEEGTAIVRLHVEQGAVRAVKVAVGSAASARDAGIHDLGVVPGVEAVAYLLDVAARARSSGVAEGAILGAAVAEGGSHDTITRRLLVIARDSTRTRGVRRAAMGWLARYAAVAASGAPGDIATTLGGRETDGDEDESLKLHAVFVLSQQRNGSGIPALLEIGSRHPDPDVRAQALFWLGQSGDPRALSLFERILRG